jgi:tRNA-guanine family transglycosylase
MKTSVRSLKTPSGTLHFPAYVPVTTFGGKYPLDALIQPYLPRLCQAVMVSYYYAQQMKQRPRLPLMVDSGGFAMLFEGSELVDRDGLGVLQVQRAESTEVLHPSDILDFQEKCADIAFTLDFPIPTGLELSESERRQCYTISNAIWALQNRRRREMNLYACIQSWDAQSAVFCAKELAKHPFDGFAIGGLVPRARDWELVSSIVEAVRQAIGDRPLHIFGLGKPTTTIKLFEMGVDSVDSSSYVKLAADGRLWENPGFKLLDPSTPELLQLAISNLATATKRLMPLSVVSSQQRIAV